jgi:riboflavin kinase/FMN adenylyltransferase
VKIIDWQEFIAETNVIGVDIALTIGVFDGIHIGHKKLFNAITSLPETITPVVITFRQNPVSILGAKPFLGNILSLNQKILKLEALGIKALVLIDFSLEFSKISGENFLDVLNSRLHIKKMVVGYNFSLGYKRDINPNKLRRLLPEVDVEVCEPTLYKGEIVSSTRIRNEISKGNFGNVSPMLEDSFKLDMKDSVIFKIDDDGLIIDKSSIKQVIPENGNYKIAVSGTQKDILADCEIDDNSIVVRLQDRIQHTSINNISFIEKRFGRS